jgi:type IV secretion system protein VirB9
MRNVLFVIFFALVFFDCTSVDMQKNVAKQNPRKAGKIDGQPSSDTDTVIAVPVDSEVIVVEKPVYIPQGSPVPVQPKGTGAVNKSIAEGVIKPQDYSYAAMIYDYDKDYVYEVYCQPLRVTDVYLKPGERVTEPPFVSDSDRWLIGAGVSYEENTSIQHIYIKTTAANLSASLIINTDQRVYHLILRSYSSVHMPMVRWKYPSKSMPETYIRGANNTFSKAAAASQDSPANAAAAAVDNSSASMANPGFISFNYRVTYSLFKKPRWMPELVYDDGSKTYITFPLHVLQTDLPAVFEDRADVVNYRVAQNVMIIDKLVTKLTIKIDKRFVVVEKRKGGK